jgi:hyperosmotically inducible periplasmic protein
MEEENMKNITYLLMCAAVCGAAVGCEKASGELRPDEKREPALLPTAPTERADDTRRNVRDRDPASPTPIDQGNNDADLSITQNIRKSLMDDDALGTTAKNVKVITKNGVVTLKGPVNSAEEKATIESKAKTVAGVQSVDNQLEIVTK